MKSRQWLSALVAALMPVSLAVVAQASQPADNQLVVRTLPTDAASASGGDGSYGTAISSNASPSDFAVTLNVLRPTGVCDDENNGVQRHKLDGTCLDYSHRAAFAENHVIWRRHRNLGDAATLRFFSHQ
jgi:hypothetical protein